jgi:phasin family protein
MYTITPQELLSSQTVLYQDYFRFANTIFEGIEKLVALNIQVVKTSLAENQVIVEKALATKGPEEFILLSSGLAQATAEKAALYGRQVAAILSSVQGEATEATKTQMATYQREGQELVSKLSKKSALAGGAPVAA